MIFIITLKNTVQWPRKDLQIILHIICDHQGFIQNYGILHCSTTKYFWFSRLNN